MPKQINHNGTLIEEHLLATNLQLRSSEISEIISNKPSFLIRWGISIFMLILIGIIATCWFIQYPDIVTVNSKLTSINAPKEIKTKIDGRLVQLLTQEGKQVAANDILGFMESRAKHQEVIQLSNAIDSVQTIVAENKFESINNYLQYSLVHLGEVQQNYQTFIQALATFKQYLINGFYSKKKAMLQEDIAYLSKLHIFLVEQKNMQDEDVKLQQENFDANESLKKDKVISALDYRGEKSKLLGKKMSLPQINAAITSNESNQHEKEKEIVELNNQIMQQQSIFSQALNTFKAQLEDWKAKYLLIAPIAGTVSFATFLQSNQQLPINKTVCFINPANSDFYAEVYIPQNNFGKIKIGQKVMMKFPSYPYQEFGLVEGKLDFISNIPTDSGYLAKVALPIGLKTNYNKQVQFREGLTAQSEIITQNLRLLQRFFYQAKSIFKSSSN